MEPDFEKHYFFESFEDAFLAWEIFQLNEWLPIEVKQQIDSPRQTHGGWIFDKETQWL